MIFVTPYNGKSPFDYKGFAKAIEKYGPLLNHSHLIVSSEEDESEAFAFGSSLSDVFASSKFLRLPQMAHRGADLPNEMFRASVRFTQAYQAGPNEVPNPPMLYGDPGYFPCKKGWLDSLQNEYYVTGAKRVFGGVQRDPEGHTRFVGPIVVSKEFGEKSALLDFLRPTSHWRETLRWELAADFRETQTTGEVFKKQR